MKGLHVILTRPADKENAANGRVLKAGAYRHRASLAFATIARGSQLTGEGTPGEGVAEIFKQFEFLARFGGEDSNSF